MWVVCLYLILMTSHWELKYCMQVWYMAYQPAKKQSCKEFIVFYNLVNTKGDSVFICIHQASNWQMNRPISCLFGVDGDVSMFCLLYLGWRHLLKPFSNSHLFLPAQTQPHLRVQLKNAVTCATLGNKFLRTQLKQRKDKARTEQEHNSRRGYMSKNKARTEQEHSSSPIELNERSQVWYLSMRSKLVTSWVCDILYEA